MIWKTKKTRMMEACMEHVKLATLYKCEQIDSNDYPFVQIIWNERYKKEPVYVYDDMAISLVSGKSYSIVKHSILDKIEDVEKIKLGEYQVVSLEFLPENYTDKQKDLLYMEAKEIHEAHLRESKNKEKAYQ